MQQVAVNIRRAREERGETQESFARALDIGLRVVQSWEADGPGQRVPRTRNLERLCELTGHSAAWFYTDHDTEPVAA